MVYSLNNEWMNEWMNDWCFRPQLCTVRLCWAGRTWANEMNFGMNHALGTVWIVQLVYQQSSVLPLYQGSSFKSFIIVTSHATNYTCIQMYIHQYGPAHWAYLSLQTRTKYTNIKSWLCSPKRRQLPICTMAAPYSMNTFIYFTEFIWYNDNVAQKR